MTMDRRAGQRDDEARPHRSLPVRLVCVALGTLFMLLGLLGAFLPLLPTTPFLLLATACYARSSRRFYGWLLSDPRFGPVIREWREHRSMPWRAKRTALILIAVSFTVSIVFFVRPWQAQLAMALGGLIIAAWLWHIPSRDGPVRGN